MALIKHLAEQLETSTQVLKGIGDDTAVLPSPEGYDILFTTDMMVENVHFSRQFGSLYQAGKKVIAVNASDIAAMGGIPGYAVISAAFPEHLEMQDVDNLYRGIKEMAAEYGIDVVGGDTVKARDIIINAALTGKVKHGNAVYRDGAREGDLLYVTGSLGKSAAGLYACQYLAGESNNAAAECARKYYLEPRARVEAGMRLGEAGMVTSMNDVSDGLASEITEICSASNKGCRLNLNEIPAAPEVREIASCAGKDFIDWALYGGEDFELIFSTYSSCREQVDKLFAEIDLPAACIGEILPPGEGIYGITPGGKKEYIQPGGYEHFSQPGDGS
ncbi:MAG: thiamine-phosphate kinase [Clostridiales bacterium]|nr:thiamine-phosphate kinase [Clostridiales bacterium]